MCGHKTNNNNKTNLDAELKEWVRVHEVLRITIVEEMLRRPENKQNESRLSETECFQQTHMVTAFFLLHREKGASLMAQTVKNLPATQETQVQSLGWDYPLEEGMATHSSILAWRIPWTEESGRLQSMGSQRVGHDWTINTFTFMEQKDWGEISDFLRFTWMVPVALLTGTIFFFLPKVAIQRQINPSIHSHSLAWSYPHVDIQQGHHKNW